MKKTTKEEDKNVRAMVYTINGYHPDKTIAVQDFKDGVICINKIADNSWITFIANGKYMDEPHPFFSVDDACRDILRRIAIDEDEYRDMTSCYYSLMPV